jgi:hypothetical protein
LRRCVLRRRDLDEIKRRAQNESTNNIKIPISGWDFCFTAEASIPLQGQSLSGTSFTSLKQLQEHIDTYVNAYNDKAEPFVWTKKKVRQRRFKGRRITQL